MPSPGVATIACRMPAPNPTIALVEDEDEVRKALVRLLRSAGFQVVAYASGDEFLRHVASQPPACVVLDLHMPGTSGHQVQAEVIRRDIPIAVVILTGNDPLKERARALENGASAFLSKPVDAAALIDTIHTVLGQNDSMP